VDVVKRNVGPSYGSTHIYDLFNERATRRNILDAFDRVRDTAKPSDTVIVYFSGLTVEVEGKAYQIPSDGRVRYRSTLVDLLEVQHMLAGTFGNRILLIDSSGVHVERSLKTVLLDDSRDNQITVLAAALPKQGAREDEKLGHGVFTFALLEGLSGKALAPNKPDLTVEELGSYVMHRTMQLSESRQTPYLQTDNGHFVLVTQPVQLDQER
jgi:uncharacterized caspase-like protein